MIAQLILLNKYLMLCCLLILSPHSCHKSSNLVSYFTPCANVFWNYQQQVVRFYGIAVGKLADSIAEKLLPWLFLNVRLGDDAIGMVMSYEAAGTYSPVVPILTHFLPTLSYFLLFCRIFTNPVIFVRYVVVTTASSE